MPRRSLIHRESMQGYRPPEITAINPDSATIVAAGAVGRTVATLSVTGGTAPIVYTIANAGGLSLKITGNLLQTNADPVGTAGVKSVSMTATDSKGKTLTETIMVTVT